MCISPQTLHYDKYAFKNQNRMPTICVCVLSRFDLNPPAYWVVLKKKLEGHSVHLWRRRMCEN